MTHPQYNILKCWKRYLKKNIFKWKPLQHFKMKQRLTNIISIVTILLGWHSSSNEHVQIKGKGL